MHQDPERSAPEGWFTVFNTCDLDRAFKALDGWEHFHTDSLRGRILSLGLKPKEAWKWFRRAEAKYRSFEPNPINRARFCYLKIYRFENALIEESLPGEGDPEKTKAAVQEVLDLPSPPSEILKNFRNFCRGLYLLHEEEYAEANRIFERLLIESDDDLDERTGFHLANSVALRGMESDEEADRAFENAALSIPALSSTFNMGIYAGIAASLLRIWDREAEALEWDSFLTVLKIPAKTIKIFQERGRRILERTQALNRVFLF